MSSERVEAWLAEDEAREDVTSRAVIPEGAKARGRVLAREPLVLAGVQIAVQVFEAMGCQVDTAAQAGDRVDADETVVEVTGSAHEVLGGERLALNLLCHLSGIATRTAAVVEAVEAVDPGCSVLATRKTTPGLRDLEHDAVEAGGGAPHRQDLADAVLVKENHLAFLSVSEAVEAAGTTHPELFVMVEAETPEEALEGARAGADGVLLDNFTPEDAADTVELVKRVDPSVTVEASGGITLETAPRYAEAVDRISLGSLTHSAPAADLSMQVEPRS